MNNSEPTMNESLRQEPFGWWCPICRIIVADPRAPVPLDHRCENYSGGKYQPTAEELKGESYQYCYGTQAIPLPHPDEVGIGHVLAEAIKQK